MMSLCCASCGIAEGDDIKLVPCDGCDLVRYCRDECREYNKSEHEEACKKRAAELRDELLFKQPESTHLGDCPICMIPLPIELKKSTIYDCCSKIICDGCFYANKKREKEMRSQQTCPFCRERTPKTKEERVKRMKKRVDANDPAAICKWGEEQDKEGDYIRAFEYYTKAAELGNAHAHYQLSLMYYDGEGVEKDEGKELYHLEEAAIAGHADARYNLGCVENDNGNVERAVKHWIISATQGYDGAIKALMVAFKKGFVEKEELAFALRAHKAAEDATKSPQRDAAEEYHRNR